MRLVLASGNRGKLAELRGLLGDLPLNLLALGDFTAEAAEETAPSFVENAILKARHAAAASGLPALADDSGLEVDALASAPCGKKHPERLGQRNGYRERDWQTRGERSSCAVAATSRASWSRDGWPRRC
jgi:hypothetical protein